MNKIHYGKGTCSLEGDGIVGLQIHFAGSVYITDKTPSNFHIVAKNNIILIFRFGGSGELTDLFEYKGTFKINNIIAINNERKKVLCKSEELIDFSELLNTNAEDMDIVSENIGADNTHITSVAKTKLLKPSRIDNLYSNGDFYDKHGEPYHGYYHADLKNAKIITGKIKDEDGKTLFRKVNGKLFITGKINGI